jgi:hypothetical protein
MGVCQRGFVLQTVWFPNLKHKHKTKPMRLRAEIKSSFFARNSQLISNSTKGTQEHVQYDVKPKSKYIYTLKCIYIYQRRIFSIRARSSVLKSKIKLHCKRHVGRSRTNKSTAEKMRSHIFLDSKRGKVITFPASPLLC